MIKVFGSRRTICIIIDVVILALSAVRSILSCGRSDNQDGENRNGTNG